MQPISGLMSAGGPLRRLVALAALTKRGSAAPPLLACTQIPLLCLLHSSSSVSGFGSHVSDNDPAVLEREKTKQQAQVEKTDCADWNELLASDSEAVV